MKFGTDGVIVRHKSSVSLQYMSMDTTNLVTDCIIVHLTGHKET